MADALRSVYATPQPNSACATVIRGADDGRSFPVIDISGPRAEVVADLDDALRRWGGFVCVGHSLDNGLMKRMLEAAYAFFALPDDVKSKVDLVQGGGGAAWRGYMPIGGERLHAHRSLAASRTSRRVFTVAKSTTRRILAASPGCPHGARTCSQMNSSRSCVESCKSTPQR